MIKEYSNFLQITAVSSCLVYLDHKANTPSQSANWRKLTSLLPDCVSCGRRLNLSTNFLRFINFHVAARSKRMRITPTAKYKTDNAKLRLQFSDIYLYLWGAEGRGRGGAARHVDHVVRRYRSCLPALNWCRLVCHIFWFSYYDVDQFISY